MIQDNGEWVASEANFTSLATPNAIGSGKTALNTLLHEGLPLRTHAAYFAAACSHQILGWSAACAAAYYSCVSLVHMCSVSLSSI